MPAFETPEPILATIEVTVGDLRIAARDRTDTVVEVRPSDPSHEPDVRAAVEEELDEREITGAVHGAGEGTTIVNVVDVRVRRSTAFLSPLLAAACSPSSLARSRSKLL